MNVVNVMVMALMKESVTANIIFLTVLEIAEEMDSLIIVGSEIIIINHV